MEFLFLLFFLFRKFESNQIKANMAMMGKVYLIVVCIYLILIASNQRGATAMAIPCKIHDCESICKADYKICTKETEDGTIVCQVHLKVCKEKCCKEK